MQPAGLLITKKLYTGGGGEVYTAYPPRRQYARGVRPRLPRTHLVQQESRQAQYNMAWRIAGMKRESWGALHIKTHSQ
jgi:hypothetical protein